ncbi:LppM family (lipo)protein [Pseudonocardia saturnea]
MPSSQGSNRSSGPDRPRRRSSLPVLLITLLIALVALSGCARVRAALAVQPDDTVRGEVVLATPETGPDDPGPVLTVPPALAGSVEVSEYRQEGYAGSLVRFTDLTFPQVGELISAAGPPGNNVRLELRRAGNRVVVDGTVDLTTVDADRADFQLKIAFPGQVLDANGDADSGEVSWVFDAGEVGDVQAVVSFADPDAPSPVNWTLGLAAVVALAAGVVVLLAHRTRNPPIRRG